MTTRSVANHRNKRNGKVESKAATVDAATLDTATQEAVTVVTPEAAPAHGHRHRQVTDRSAPFGGFMC